VTGRHPGSETQGSGKEGHTHSDDPEEHSAEGQAEQNGNEEPGAKNQRGQQVDDRQPCAHRELALQLIRHEWAHPARPLWFRSAQGLALPFGR
jgi:hypothetical protein